MALVTKPLSQVPEYKHPVGSLLSEILKRIAAGLGWSDLIAYIVEYVRTHWLHLPPTPVPVPPNPTPSQVQAALDSVDASNLRAKILGVLPPRVQAQSEISDAIDLVLNKLKGLALGLDWHHVSLVVEQQALTFFLSQVIPAMKASTGPLAFIAPFLESYLVIEKKRVDDALAAGG